MTLALVLYSEAFVPVFIVSTMCIQTHVCANDSLCNKKIMKLCQKFSSNTLVQRPMQQIYTLYTYIC